VIRAVAAVLVALATAGPAGATVDPELTTALREHASVHVIVAFRDGPGPPGAGAARASRVARLRARAVALAGSGLHAGPLWTTVMAMPGTATPAAVARLAADPDVARVGLDPGGRVGDAESGALIGAQAAAAAGLTGRGVTVGIIDTGIDRTHPDLASSVVAEHCFAPPDGCPNVTGEQDGPGSARDDAGHGSSVAGIVTADGVLAPAATRRLSVAPGGAATFLVRFVPRRALSYRRTLTLTTNAPARGRIAMALSGRGAR
jgi:subtilisin family serine protease